MSKSLFKFPSIGQFRNTVYDVNYHDDNSVIDFERTVKIHGSNASIVVPLWGDKTIYAQSRNNIITPEKDNAGFARWVEDNRTVLTELLDKECAEILGNWDDETHIVIYGEWCGEGIQKNVAVNKLPKMFVVFGYRVIFNNDLEDRRTASYSVSRFEDEPLDFTNHDIGLYNIHEFGSEIVTIDFNNIIDIQSKLEADAEEVGRQCPVGTWFGVEGPGEGHVYNSVQKRYKFKMKSDAHKVSKKATFSDAALEEMDKIAELVDALVLVPRLEQGIEYLKEMHIPSNDFKSMGEYISWVITDVNKEESDVISESGLSLKLVNKEIAKRARIYFQKYVNTNLHELYRKNNPKPNLPEAGLL